MKTGLVVEGGSLRSAFTCGVLKSWCEAGIQFDTVIASGAGALAAVYFRAAQGEALEALYGDYFEARGEIGRLAAWKGDRAVDALALLDTAWEKHPLDMAAFSQAPGTLLAATTRSDNGDAVYWPLERVDNAKHLRQFLRAAVTFPGDGDAVQLIERSYYDGSVSTPLAVEEALAQGVERLVVLRTHLAAEDIPRARLTPAAALALSDQPMTKNAYLLRHLHGNQALKTLHQLENDGRALVVAPVVESTSIHRYGVSRSAASEFYGEGLRLGRDAVHRISTFLEAAHE